MNEAPSQGTVACVIHFESGRRGRKLIQRGRPPQRPKAVPQPRLSRLMALAVKLESLIKKGLVRDYADLARLGAVDRSLVSRVMNLRLLAPSIQMHLLELDSQENDSQSLFQKDLMPIARILDWSLQEGRYFQLCRQRNIRTPFRLGK